MKCEAATPTHENTMIRLPSACIFRKAGAQRPIILCFAAALLWTALAQAATFPTPSIYPVSWQLDFTHSQPKRIVVNVPGHGPLPYYYMTYTVTNNTGQEQTFFPIFTMVSREGKTVQSDNQIPPGVFEEIKGREKLPDLLSASQIAGELLQGDDQAKTGVAIWPEPDPRMGAFSIYVGGLSGEFVVLKDDQGNEMKDAKGNPIILRKTLQLNYLIQGDEIYPGEDKINQLPEKWVMR